jgi:ParB family transcriptional regulator, chromosome partitioning protein
MAKPVLGRGLGALLGGVPTGGRPAPPASEPPPTSTAGDASHAPESREMIRLAPIQQVRPCPFQPRKDFSEESIRELADSIREQGIIQPLIVRARPDGFELIAGERRWRAAQAAGLTEVPIIVREADDRQVLELALIENLQRENLNAIEESLGYSQLITQFNLTQEEAALKVGKSRAAVANALRLLKLDPELQAYVRDGRLSVGHAKVLLALTSPTQQQLAAERILKNALSVRQTEELVAHLQAGVVPAKPGKTPSAPVSHEAHLADIESKAKERFATKVRLRYRQGKGSLEIQFFSDDDLERILRLAGVHLD